MLSKEQYESITNQMREEIDGMCYMIHSMFDKDLIKVHLTLSITKPLQEALIEYMQYNYDFDYMKEHLLDDENIHNIQGDYDCLGLREYYDGIFTYFIKVKTNKLSHFWFEPRSTNYPKQYVDKVLKEHGCYPTSCHVGVKEIESSRLGWHVEYTVKNKPTIYNLDKE